MTLSTTWSLTPTTVVEWRDEMLRAQVQTKRFALPAVLDASFAWWMDEEAERQGQSASALIKTLYAELGDKGHDDYAAGKRILRTAELVIGRLCRLRTHAAAVQRALLNERCPNSAVGIVGDFRVGSANIRHVALKARAEENGGG